MRPPVLPCVSVTLLLTVLLGCGPGPDPDRERTLPTDTLAEFVARNQAVGVIDLERSERPIDAEGWHGPEPVGWWTAHRDAFVAVELDAEGPGFVEIRAGRIDPGIEAKTLTLSLNGFVLGDVDLPPRPRVFRLDVPDGVIRRGRNEIGLACDRLHTSGSRELGLYVDWVRVASEDADWAYTRRDEEPFLSAHEWIDGNRGFLVSGTFDIDWVAEGSPIDAASETRLALVEVDAEGRVVAEWDAASIADSAGSIRLRAPADVDVGAPGRLVLTSADEDVRVRLTGVERRTAPRDDVLLIVIDTLRADALSIYGAPAGRSTVIDSLAMNGILFRNAVAHSPITGPSHASIFTSRTPLAAGIVNNHEGELTWDVPTLAEVLRWNGYRCQGAISISPIVRRHGFARGFHAWDQELGAAFLRRGSRTLEPVRAFFAAEPGGDPQPRFTLVHLSEPHEPYDAYGTVDERARLVVDDEVVADVSLSDFEPGILELELDAGRHTLRIETTSRTLVRRFEIRSPGTTGARLEDEVPLDLPAGSWSTALVLERPGTVELIRVLNDHRLGVHEIRRRYGLESAQTDRLVGDLMRMLRSSGRADRTWVVFTADHGESLGEHNHIGHVKNLFEPSVRVPLIVCPPAGRDAPRGVVRDDLAAGIDVLPTILDLVGIDVPDAAEGRSLRHHTPRDRTVLVQTNTPQAPSTRYAHRGVDWKLVWNVDRETTRYFDLARDPGEREDVAPQHPELVDRRRKALEERVFDLLSTNRRAEASIDPETEAALRALGYMN